MRRVVIVGPLAFVLALLTGCAASESTPAARDDAIIDYSEWPALLTKPVPVAAETYFRCLPDPRALTLGPHFVPAIKVYVNPTAVGALAKRDNQAMPVGSTVVKEKWPSIEPGGRPDAYAAMIKREADYDSAHGDWEYVFVQLAGERSVQRGKLASCINCHTGAAGEDYLFLPKHDAK